MKRYLITFLVVFFVLVAIAFGVYSLQKPKEIVPNQAATQSGVVNLNLDSGSSNNYASGQSGIIYLKVSLPSGTSVDGFQVFATASGTIPSDLTFVPSAPSGTQMVLNDFQKTTSTASLKLAYITQNPQAPFTGANATLGYFTFTAPASGKMDIAFDNTLTKIVQSGDSKDILGIPQTETYTFTGQSPAPTSSTSSTSSPTTCTRGIQSVSLEPSSQTGYRGQALTYTITVRNNDDSNCEKANFSLSAILPYANWTANFAQTVLSIAPQTSASTTVIFTPAANSPYGTLPVGVNTVGPKAALVAAANYIVQTPTPTPYASTVPEKIYIKSGDNGIVSESTASSSPTSTPIVETTTEEVPSQQEPAGIMSKIPTYAIYGVGGLLLVVLFFILKALFSSEDKNKPPKITPPTQGPPSPTPPPTAPGGPTTPSQAPQGPQLSHSVDAPLNDDLVQE